MKKRILLIYISSFLLLSACADSPSRAAKDWFDAMLNLDGNRILERTCLEYRPAIQEWGLWNSAISLLPQVFFGIDMKSNGDVSDLEFTTINMQDNNASVYVSGEIRVAVLAFAQSYSVDETWIMVREENKWRWCGLR